MIQSGMKILVIRFSSLGDITQALSVPSRLGELFPLKNDDPSSEQRFGEIHWVTRADMAPLIEGHPFVSRIWKFNRGEGLTGLFQLIWLLKKERFTHIYDAHNNLRSHLISAFLRPPLAPSRIFDPPLFLRKSQKRWKRFLLFKLRMNRFEKPFSGQRDLLEPLTKWGLSKTPPPAPQIVVHASALKKAQQLIEEKNISQFIVLAPSAAYPLKRWPLNHFKKLIELLPNENFICLGGKEDSFIAELEQVDRDRVFNFAGQTNLQESTAMISLAKYVVCNDTGLLHISEQLGKRTAALMGPAPFGFPSRESTRIFELDLACRPCSKHGQGPCINPEFQKCLVDISPESVASEVKNVSR